MMFWLIAISMLVLSGLVLAWPLLSTGSNWKAAGLALFLVVPLSATFLYREVGNPLAMNPPPPSTGGEDFNALTDNLKSGLQEREEDLEGWLLLGRSLKSLQRFDEALDALETANRISPDDPLVTVELAEAKLFASGNPQINPEVREMLQSAVNQDPSLQKGLWLLGIDAVQRGEDVAAIEYWERLLDQVEPDSGIAASVQEQIGLARQRAGLEAPPVQTDSGSWTGVGVNISLGDEAIQALETNSLPATAVLFVIARPAGLGAGPPLGVVRIDRPEFPIEVTLDDRHAMLQQNQLSAQSALSIQARLSLSGNAAASSGDWSSEAIDVSTDDPGPHTLSLVIRAE